jgi:ferredoxin-nitrite reductase
MYVSIYNISGLDKHELFDTRALTKKIDSWYSGNGQGNPEWANLPRKFNIAISGSRGIPIVSSR